MLAAAAPVALEAEAEAEEPDLEAEAETAAELAEVELEDEAVVAAVVLSAASCARTVALNVPVIESILPWSVDRSGKKEERWLTQTSKSKPGSCIAGSYCLSSWPI
jgi:hypothetical protein